MFANNIEFLLDDISWSYSLSLITLFLAAILTATPRVFNNQNSSSEDSTASNQRWIPILVLVALGLLATMAGNLLTLVIMWVTLDIFEAILAIGDPNEERTDRLIKSLATRAAGILITIWVITIAYSREISIEIDSATPQMSYFLLLASALRLGVLPKSQLPEGGDNFQRGYITIIRLVPVTSSLMVLSRTNTIGTSEHIIILFIIIACLAGFYGSFSWILAKNEISGISYWILSMSSLSLIASVQGFTTASLSWGIALLLSGGVLFLYSYTNKLIRFIPILGLLGLLGLPFTPSWHGTLIYSPTLPIFLIILIIIIHSAILFGYLKQLLKIRTPMNDIERIATIIYPWGLLLIPFIQYLIYIIILTYSSLIGERPPLLHPTWIVLIPYFIVGVIFILNRRGYKIQTIYLNRILNLLSFNWLYATISWIFQRLGTLINFIDYFFESRGALLWTILFLTLIISLLLQIS